MIEYEEAELISESNEERTKMLRKQSLVRM
jgi:hypothetical protein